MATPSDFFDYKNWVQEAKHPGMRVGENGLEDAEYIPIQSLRDYWDEERVRQFLTDDSGHNQLDSAPAHTIVQDYLRIFATLVYISTYNKSWIGYLDPFVRRLQDDNHLPFDSKDLLGTLIHHPDGRDTMESFHQHQFLFSPIQLASPNSDGGQTLKLYDRHLDSKAVLPMVFQHELSHSRDSAPAAQLGLFKLPTSSGLTTEKQLVVAKIFPETELEYDFRTERSAYFALNRGFRAQPQLNNVLDYYGSFVQSGRGVILIEYANHGSLLELFEENNPPYTREEMIDLWYGLANLFDGLAAFHNLDVKRPGDVVGVHQDLSPSNIFVISDDTPARRKYRFKIGDFGLSRLKFGGRADDGIMSDSKGPPRYRAPELIFWGLDQDALDPGVTTKVDIWSIGCVLIEAAVWSVCGERGRKEFCDNLDAETATKSAAACHGTFHDGTTILAAVRNVTETLRPRLRVYDNFTLRLCVWICEKLLAGPKAFRLDADQAGHYMQQEIRHAQSEAHKGIICVEHDTDSSTEPTTASKPILPQRPVSLEEPGPVKRPSDNKARPHSCRPDIIRPSGAVHPEMNGHPVSSQPLSRPSATTVGSLIQRRRDKTGLLEDLQDIPGILADRDQVFLIDDSSSMADFADPVNQIVEWLASVEKSVDPGGMELRFTSKPRTPYKGKHVADLLRHIASHRPPKSECRMEAALNLLMDSLVPSQEKGSGRRSMMNRTTRSVSKAGISVYILTNGVWSNDRPGANARGPPAMFGVDESVKTVAQRLQNAEKQLSYLSLQFIRFGHNAAGKARLRYLDNEMKNEVGWDIVDRRRWDGPVLPMLVGALNEREDLESDESDDEYYSVDEHRG